MKRVAGYCRVSTKSDDQDNSFVSQQNTFKRMFAKKAGYQLVDIYADEGLSGTKIKRPELNRLLSVCGITPIIDDDTGRETDNYKISGKSRIDEIYVTNISRFARNLGGADTLIKLLMQNNVALVYIANDDPEEPEIYSSMTELGYDYIQNELKAAEHFSRDLSRKVKSGMRRGRQDGHIYVSSSIYGYTYLPKVPRSILEANPGMDAGNRLVINEEQAKVVRMIYDLYVNEGIGTERLARKLSAENILTATGKPRWTSTAVNAILRNAKYCGMNDGGKYTKGRMFGDRRLQHVPLEAREEYFYQSDKIPAIISRELYDSAQERRKQTTTYEINKGRYIGKTDYAGLVVCGECGALYHSCGTKKLKESGNIRRYYACGHRYRYETGKQCLSRSVSQEELDAELTGRAYMENRYAAVVNGLESISALNIAMVAEIDADHDSEVEKLKKDQANNKDALTRLVRLYTAGDIDRDILDEEKEKLNREAADLAERIAALSKDNEAIRADITELLTYRDAFIEEKQAIETMMESGTYDEVYNRKALLKDIKQITIYPDNIDIEFKSVDIFDSFVKTYIYDNNADLMKSGKSLAQVLAEYKDKGMKQLQTV